MTSPAQDSIAASTDATAVPSAVPAAGAGPGTAVAAGAAKREPAPERAALLFAGAADLYAAYRPQYPDEAFDHLARTLGLGPASRVLDVGCGPGTISLPLSARVGAVVAVDPSPEMLATARRHAADRGVASISFHQGRAEDLPGLPLGRVDHAVFGRSFHWTDRAAVAGILAALLPEDGAIVLFTSAGAESRRRPWQPVVEPVRAAFLGERGSPEDPRSGLSREPHDEVLAAGPFSQIERTLFVAHKQYSLDQVVGLQTTFSYSTPRLLGDRVEEYTTAVRQAVLDGLGEGPYSVEEGTEVLIARRPGAAAAS